MPIPILVQAATEGLSSIPYVYTVLKIVPWVLLVLGLKYFFGGARNRSERLMHSKVIMITGGTSGIGASVVHELASRGAQIILLTQHPPSDIFLVDYIEDLRKSTKNQLIYAEQVDLSSLHSIRAFATKWIDNLPPRRLDMIILCASTAAPTSGKRTTTIDGLDQDWQINYLANFHLLSILSPALRAQPADRDVRIIFTTCSGYIGAKMDLKQAAITGEIPKPSGSTPKTITKAKAKGKSSKRQATNLFGLSKLSLMIFAHSFQSHLNAYKRPDGQPPNAHVFIVDPGLSRTPGTRRWLTGGSLWGLLLYLLTWPIWWLVLKSPQQGAQSILYAAMEARYRIGPGGWFIKECREMDVARREIRDDEAGKKLWKFSEEVILEKEKEAAVKRALAKKTEEEKNKSQSVSNNKSGKAATAGTNQQASGSKSRKGGK
ncbi:hypothetical protein MPDQ_007065 [Monascus purpureus]|uniref:Uncharacterized protein n=1 Tax=Monascus purpureus TaxID=5098 RepID=A0A507R5A4_MONPU|nr:hypothetical protein MPDQ_007065 [Monascus purpureus]BDD55354.1 hypothetical protein MAP00_000881 [Monascus purpureus]